MISECISIRIFALSPVFHHRCMEDSSESYNLSNFISEIRFLVTLHMDMNNHLQTHKAVIYIRKQNYWRTKILRQLLLYK